MRLAQLLWVLAAGAGTATWAQTSVPPAAAAAWLNPAAPSRPLNHLPLPHSGAVIELPQDWRAAHAAVAEFPRGHADVVRWEAAQQAQTLSSAPVHKGHP